jgi:proton-dependent oligopeptide transporter, POT family
MSALASNEAPIIAASSVTDAQHIFAATEKELGRGSIDVGKQPGVELATVPETTDDVTEEDLRTLRRVSGKIPWQAYTIAFVELCERFSYYGTTVVCKSIKSPPPPSRF